MRDNELTNYQRRLCAEAAHDIMKAYKILKDIDHNVGYSSGSMGGLVSLLGSTKDILFTLHEEFHQLGKIDD